MADKQRRPNKRALSLLIACVAATILIAISIVTNLQNTQAASPAQVDPGCQTQFTDVPENSAFFAFVRCLACNDIIAGYDCGDEGEPCNANNDPWFRPYDLLTRGQLAKIVSSAAGFNDPRTSQTFTDVPRDHAFNVYVERLANRLLIKGYPCGGPDEPCDGDGGPYFRPDSNATRGQIAKIIVNAAGFSNPPGSQVFEDVATDGAFYNYVQRLASRHFIEGYPCGSANEPCGPDNRPYFRPDSEATRGQTAKIVGNTFFPGCNPTAGP